jgi:uncharacterized membrane protein YgcG
VLVRVALVVLAAALLIIGADPGRSLAQDEGWVIDRFDVELVVTPDGLLTVTETIAVDFRDLGRRGIFREIPYRYAHDDEHERVIRISDWEVAAADPGTPTDLQLTTEDRIVRARIGDPNTTITGRHTYRIRYQVEGALNAFPDHAELYWNVTGEGWPVPIRRATARVTGSPVVDVACFAGPTGSSLPCPELTLDDAGLAEVAATDLAAGEGLTAVAAFPPGEVEVVAPILDARWSLTRALTGSAASLPLAGLTALLAFGGVGLLVAREGRDRVARGGMTIDGREDPTGGEVRRGLFSQPAVPVRFRPPEDLRPAHLGLLVDERIDPVEISATVVDLAVRGHLQIQEVPTLKVLFWSKTDWVLRRQEAPDEQLSRWERRLLDGLFEDGDEVILSELSGSFHRDYRSVRDMLYDESVQQGWFRRSPETTRGLWLFVGFAALLLTGGLLAVLLVNTTFAAAGVPPVAAALGLLAANRRMPHRTPKGSRLLNETLGFREFIATAEAGRAEFAEEAGIFTRYLPYAVVFGVTDKWARAFEHLGEAATAAAGAWYVGPDGSIPRMDRLAGGVGDLSTKAGSTLMSTPSSSGSSGFGGGGSSGGGMGGGGGGSW